MVPSSCGFALVVSRALNRIQDFDNRLENNHLHYSSLPIWPPWTAHPITHSTDNIIFRIPNRRTKFKGQRARLWLVLPSGTVSLSLTLNESEKCLRISWKKSGKGTISRGDRKWESNHSTVIPDKCVCRGGGCVCMLGGRGGGGERVDPQSPFGEKKKKKKIAFMNIAWSRKPNA